MSDKPRVYQGVRVKTTVKELLQRHRAREADSSKVKTTSQACLDLPDLCPSSLPNRCVNPPPAVPHAAARTIQLRTASFPFPDSSCNIQMQESTFDDIHQQLGDMMFPSNGDSCSNIHSSTVGGGGCTASLPPLSTLPLPWCHGLSSDTDYYGQEMAPCSSPEYLKHCNPMDPNSYSPQDSFSSSSSSSCYDSPTRMESSYHVGFNSEHFHYQNCSLQDCYCLPHCWPSQQESFSAPECAPHYNPTDFTYACPVEENYFRRDLQMSSEMCYNAL